MGTSGRREPDDCAILPTCVSPASASTGLVLPLDPPFPAAWDPVPRRSFAATIVRVETDEGVVGVGSGDTMDGFDAFEHLFIGRTRWRSPTTSGSSRRSTSTPAATGRSRRRCGTSPGQVAGVPVATLFGGATTGIPAYASCGLLLAPAARAESALRLRDEGFRALKIRVDPRRLEEGLASVAATRHAVGDSMAIMVDLNQGWRMAGDTTPSLDPVAAREIAVQLAELRRPVARGAAGRHGPGRPGGAPGAGTGVRIAGGEMTRTFAELLAAVEADAFDVHQPDVVLAGGMLRGRTIAELALARGRWYTPTRGRTASGCSPTCTSPPASVADRSSSSRTTRPAGPRNAATSCSPSRCGPVATGCCASRPTPGLGVVLDESAMRRYAA